MLKNIEVRRVGPYLYDLFMDNQWDAWSRVRKGRSSTFVTAGAKLPHAVLKALDEVLHPIMPITYGQQLSTMLTHNDAINNG